MTRKLAYAGVRIGNDGKLAYHWHAVDEQLAPEKYASMVFGKKNIVGYCSPGQVYEVTAPEDSPDSVYTSGTNRPRFVGHINDPELQKAWAVYSETERTQYEQQAMLRGEKRDQLMDMPLRELVRVSRRMMPWRRRALIAFVIDKLSGVSEL